MNAQDWLQSVRKTAVQWLTPAPVMPAMPLRSPYRDSTQIGISAMATFKPSDFRDDGFEGVFSKDGEKDQNVLLCENTNESLKKLFADNWRLISVSPLTFQPVTMRGTTRVYKSFKPNKLVLTEMVWATYGGKGLPDKTISEPVDDAADAVLYMAFAGADNCFPNAPTQECGIAGPVLGSGATNNEISWPTINGGIDMTVGFMLEGSVLSRAKKDLPPGYDPTPKFMRVQLRLNLLGPSLR